jgi:hypothetical protein
MAIVLVIIGLILAAVMKGRDLVNSAEGTSSMQGFFLKWKTMATDYLKGTGWPPCDGQQNGGTDTTRDGWAESVAAFTDDDEAKIEQAFFNAGIDLCQNIKGNLFGDADTGTGGIVCGSGGMETVKYKVDSEYTGPTDITVGFGSLKLDKADDQTAHGYNLLIFYNVPLDYARRIDKIVDGKEIGNEGLCVNLSYDDSAADTPEAKGNTDVLSAANTNFAHSTTTSWTAQDWPSVDTADKGYMNNYYVVGIILKN